MFLEFPIIAAIHEIHSQQQLITKAERKIHNIRSEQQQWKMDERLQIDRHSPSFSFVSSLRFINLYISRVLKCFSHKSNVVGIFIMNFNQTVMKK